jgi:hypothetical protein
MPNYPAQIDTSLSLPQAVDTVTPVQSSVFNSLRSAVIAIENELGVKPSGLYSTVRSRLDTIETTVGNLRIIELDQDLGGTLESPLVIGLQGRPVSDAGPLVNNVLTWDGIAWTPQPPKGLIDVALACDLAGDKTCQIVVGLQGNPIDPTPPTAGDILRWTGSAWSPGYSPPGPASANTATLVAGNFTTNSSTPVRIGGRDLDMSFFPATITPLNRTVRFRALIETTSSAATAQIQLVDVTNNAVITGSIGTTSVYTGLVLFDSGPLTVGTSNGDIRTDMIAVYEAQLSLTTGNPSSDRAICANARIDIIYS